MPKRTDIKIGSTHYRYVEFRTFAYVAKFHEYADGSKQCLSFEFGWPLLMQAINTAHVYERQGYDQFYEPGEPDLPTAAHHRGYREAERNYHWLMENNASEMYDEEHYWQY